MNSQKNKEAVKQMFIEYLENNEQPENSETICNT